MHKEGACKKSKIKRHLAYSSLFHRLVSLSDWNTPFALLVSTGVTVMPKSMNYNDTN